MRAVLHRYLIDTPLGKMLALSSGAGLCALEFHAPGRMQRLDARLRRFFEGCATEDREDDVLAATRGWLRAYFDGERADASGLQLDQRGAAFERRVWEALLRIPPGATTSYGAIAKQLGAPGASRAVGMANGANPISIVVPCHRVIGASGRLTGYGGGLDRKRWLLQHEARWWPTLRG